MKVKKFVAPNMPEAMKKVRHELGQDAVILNSKEIKTGGVFGFFSKKNIEVIAAVDPQPIQSRSTVKQKMPKKTVEKSSNELNTPLNKNDNRDIIEEIKELKALMRDISSKERTVEPNYPEPIQNINQILKKQGVIETIREDLVSGLLENWYVNKGNVEFKHIEQWLKNDLIEKLNDFSYGTITDNKQFLNVVGPTGVGKTTTLAKIAAQSVLKYHKKVAFITTDTYRIAAIDQLKTYAKILGVPVEVSYNLDDFKKAKEKFSDYDLVLIDTAGRNFRNKTYVDELKNVIDFDNEMETFLVLAATAKYIDMKAIVEQFSLLNIDKFIFTKLDETQHYGGILNLIFEYKKGVSYLTNGQNVPDDIIEANPQVIINTLFGEEKS